MASERPPRPRAFRLDNGAPASGAVVKTPPAPFDDGGAAERQIALAPPRRRAALPLGSLALTGFGGLITLSFGLWTDALIESLFARAGWLGWAAVGFLVLGLIGLAAYVTREALAVRRQTRIAELHAALALARAADDRDQARAGVRRLAALYADRPETARARAGLEEAMVSIVDGRDLIDIAERSLLKPLDGKAQAEIAAAAKRVSLVTAVSPRAILDLLFVLYQAAQLCRGIAEIYGGRPGLFGFLKLARAIGGHLALTGGMAVGDSLIQQLVGHGIASKLSARLGEGVLNGLLTARVGVSALSVCRPAPFGVAPQPGVTEVAPFLFSGGKDT